MEKTKRIAAISAIVTVIVILCCLLTLCNSDEKDVDFDKKTEKYESEKGVTEDGSVVIDGTTDDEGNTIVNENVEGEEPTVSGDMITTGDNVEMEEETTSSVFTDIDQTTDLNEDTASEVVVGEEKTSIADKATSSKEPTTSKKTTDSKESTASKKTTGSNETTTSKKPITEEETTTSKKPTETTEIKKPAIQEETTADSRFNIAFNAPDIVLVNDIFDISVIATNCAHIEWYINGEYDATLEKKINPSGTLQFTKSGIYRITVIGYTEDWKQNVWYDKTIRVFDDLSQANGNAKECDRAMYSWDHDFIYLADEPMLQKVMELTECNILYQEISPNASAEDVTAFLQRRGEKGQTVYYLCGNASWAIEKDASSMLREVERVIAYNEAAGEHKFVGIQFDVEPYCLTDFEDNADEYMAQYVKNSKLAYEAAHEAGLLVEICIPYWWESAYGYYDELEELIANACDSVAVMNYYKMDKEAYHIEHEVALCKKYDKRIINITETIPPGLHGLTENNTYYNDGIDAIEEMWNTLDGYFQYDKMGYAFHWMEVIIEMLDLN